MNKELTINQINQTKGLAICFMLMLHLFATRDYKSLYTPLVFLYGTPLTYYFALFGDCCVAIFCFCSGYGLHKSFLIKSLGEFKRRNFKRIIDLYLNLWLILIIFVLIIGPILRKQDEFPGDIFTFFLNSTALQTSYNGAWWFFTVYILLSLTALFLFKILEKINFKKIITISFILYSISYAQRIKQVFYFDNAIIDWFFNYSSLYGMSLFPFLIGYLFSKHNTYSIISNFMSSYLKYINTLGTLLIFLMMVLHGYVQSLFVAVFTGIAVICIFNLLNKPTCINTFFNFCGDHSTNIWLTHMFFSSSFLKEVVYYPKYSILIFLWLMVLCVITSFAINFLLKIFKAKVVL